MIRSKAEVSTQGGLICIYMHMSVQNSEEAAKL